MSEEYSYSDFPLDVVEVICDECLTRCEVKRGGYSGSTYILKCPCGKRQMEVHNYRFKTGSSKRVLVSTFLKKSDRKPGQYHHDVGQSRMLIELDTDILLETDEDVQFFVWATNNGSLPYSEIERRATKLMEIYNKFKHLQGAPEPTLPEDSEIKKELNTELAAAIAALPQR